jgi:4,5-DOPA dioxygenase extradiol
VLIVGSGNMIHNLRMAAWDKLNGPEYGFDWALEINATFKEKIAARDHTPLIDYESLGTAGALAIPTPDHYLPLLYTLGLQEKDEETTIFNDRVIGGSLNMTSVRVG